MSDIPPDREKKIIERSIALRNAESDQFKEKMRDMICTASIGYQLQGAVRAFIIEELRAKGGIHADVAELARYGAIMLHEYRKENQQKA